jgi:hypothetical protein
MRGLRKFPAATRKKLEHSALLAITAGAFPVAREAEFPKSGHRLWNENSAKTKDSKQTFVG